jgi:hypothetical protein
MIKREIKVITINEKDGITTDSSYIQRIQREYCEKYIQ